MKHITVEIPDEEAALLEQLAGLCTEANKSRGNATTHGALTVPALLTMLAEDAALVLSRPGSWEAAHMTTVLSSHGYQL